MGVRYNRLTFRSACLLKGARRDVRCRGVGNAPDGMIDGTETLAMHEYIENHKDVYD